MKDDRGREDDRENATNGDDRKGMMEDVPMDWRISADLYASY